MAPRAAGAAAEVSLIPTTIIAGGTAEARERAVAGLLAPGQSTAIILEGLPSGTPVLDEAPGVALARIAPGCLCCAGQLVLRVTLNRMLGRTLHARPQRLFIGLADEAHADQLRSWLSLTPYDQLLELGPALRA